MNRIIPIPEDVGRIEGLLRKPALKQVACKPMRIDGRSESRFRKHFLAKESGNQAGQHITGARAGKRLASGWIDPDVSGRSGENGAKAFERHKRTGLSGQ